MRKPLYAIVTTALAVLALAALLALRFAGMYSHQALAVALLLGLNVGGREPRLAGLEGAPAHGTAARVP